MDASQILLGLWWQPTEAFDIYRQKKWRKLKECLRIGSGRVSCPCGRNQPHDRLHLWMAVATSLHCTTGRKENQSPAHAPEDESDLEMLTWMHQRMKRMTGNGRHLI